MHPPRYAEQTDIPELELLAGELLPDCPIPEFRVSDPNCFCVIIHGGYLYAQIEKWNGSRVVFVISAAALPTALPGDRRAAYNMLESWAKERGLPQILALTKHPEVFLKRWDFRLESFLISKDLTSAKHKK